MTRTFSPPDLSSHPPTEPSVCAALDDVPIQHCSLGLSGNDDDKHEENHLYIFTFTLFFHHQPESKNLKDPQILLRDLQSVDVNLTAQY